MTLVDPAQCFTCKHFDRQDGLSCSAFDRIPGEILDMNFDHRKPYPGDQGVRWEPKEPDVKNPFDEFPDAK